MFKCSILILQGRTW